MDSDIPTFMLAKRGEVDGTWIPSILKVPVFGSMETVFIAFDDYLVGEEFINRVPAAADSEVVPVRENEFRASCRSVAAAGVEYVLIYFMARSDQSLMYRMEGILKYTG